MPKSIPKSLHKFFWDTDPGKLNPAQNSRYIIARLLDKGDLNAASWVLNNYDQQSIRDTLTSVRDFSPITGNFWSNYLNIPRDQILCLQKPYRRMRRTHWPY